MCVPRGQKAIFPDVHDEKEKQEFISKGVSLWDIAEHSAESGGDLQCVLKTDPKAPLAIPSVIHWKLGHFSALTGKDGDGRIHLEDAMMKYDSWVEASVLAEESSGYALLPKETSLPKGYRLVEKAEAREILGRHCVHGFDDEGRNYDSKGNLYQGEPLATFIYYGNEPSKYYNKYVLKNNSRKNCDKRSKLY